MCLADANLGMQPRIEELISNMNYEETCLTGYRRHWFLEVSNSDWMCYKRNQQSYLFGIGCISATGSTWGNAKDELERFNDSIDISLEREAHGE